MFNGVQEVTFDDKGRITIPSKFKESLRFFSTSTLCTTLKARTHLLLYPEENWKKVSEQLMSLATTGNRVLQSFQQLVLSNMEKLVPDSSGRILVPSRLKTLVEFALEKEVVMVGRADRLEIWGKDRWYAQTNEILDMDPETLEKELSNTGLQI